MAVSTPEKEKIVFHLNGEKLKVDQGSSIIEAADAHGVHIPRFCYHSKLSVVANCRMCLVEVEGSPKPLAACSTPITQDMKVKTKSAVAMDAQKTVMEFMLINHPLECPICDQGGECELQDTAMGYGQGISRFSQNKRVVQDEDLGPLVKTNMSLCIHCTRCVRFGSEIAGIPELGEINRGTDMEISTYLERGLTSEMSGNVIDLCPVGALTSKPAEYKGRSWEFKRHPSIAVHDCIGSHVYVHTSNTSTSQTKVMRVLPRYHPNINETWLSDRDRFSYQALYSKNRLKRPICKQGDGWIAISWTQAIEKIASAMIDCKSKQRADHMACYASAITSTEDYFLLQHLFRKLGATQIDHRVDLLDNALDERRSIMPGMGFPLTDIMKMDHIFLIGSYVRQEQPLACHWIRKAALQGCKVDLLHAIFQPFNFSLNNRLLLGPQYWVMALLSIAKLIAKAKKVTCPLPKSTIKWSEEEDKTIEHIANQLLIAKNACMFLGPTVFQHPNAGMIQRICLWINHACKNTRMAELTQGCNAAGAWMAGMIPHRNPFGDPIEAQEKQSLPWEKPCDFYWIHNIDPCLDTAQPHKAKACLKQAKFVVAASSFDSQTYRDYADIILPLAPWTETSGSMINAMHDWQTFEACQQPLEENQAGWKLILKLLQTLSIDLPCEPTFDAVQTFLKEGFDTIQNKSTEPNVLNMDETFSIDTPNNDLYRFSSWPMVKSDVFVRQALALQHTRDPYTQNIVRIHPKTAKEKGLENKKNISIKQDCSWITLPLLLDENIAKNTIFCPAGTKETNHLGDIIGKVDVMEGQND
jgi:NADH-quinone oxidoreductase subunit G